MSISSGITGSFLSWNFSLLLGTISNIMQRYLGGIGIDKKVTSILIPHHYTFWMCSSQWERATAKPHGPS